MFVRQNKDTTGPRPVKRDPAWKSENKTSAGQVAGNGENTEQTGASKVMKRVRSVQECILPPLPSLPPS